MFWIISARAPANFSRRLDGTPTIFEGTRASTMCAFGGKSVSVSINQRQTIEQSLAIEAGEAGSDEGLGLEQSGRFIYKWL